MLGRFARKVSSDTDPKEFVFPIAPIDDDEPDSPVDKPEHAEPAGPVTAVPELTHPGESASNGLAERSVETLEDYIRTLLTALQSHMKLPLNIHHPLASWVVKHASYCLNVVQLGRDGRTAYGRLHGREARMRICELGEKVLWYVHVKLRAKADQRWRYGCFLGRSLGSDQNFIGLANGGIIRARAMVRLTPDAQRLLSLKATPLAESTKWLDKIEEHEQPQKHDPQDEGEDRSSSSHRRVRITLKDLRDSRIGFTPLLPSLQLS